MAEPTARQRLMFAKMGIAMPDGSYYIRDATDLQNAIDSVGRATPNAGESEVSRRNSVRRHIMKRANQLKMPNRIPDTWAPDGSLKQPVAVHISAGEEFIAHFGRKGMKWGEHVFGNGRGGGSSPIHSDVSRARAAQQVVRTHGLSALGNDQLRDLNKRTQLETDYARLNSHTSEGRKIVQQIAREQSKAIASGYVAQYGPKGIEWLVRNGIKVVVGSGRHTKF